MLISIYKLVKKKCIFLKQIISIKGNYYNEGKK